MVSPPQMMRFAEPLGDGQSAYGTTIPTAHTPKSWLRFKRAIAAEQAKEAAQ